MNRLNVSCKTSHKTFSFGRRVALFVSLVLLTSNTATDVAESKYKLVGLTIKNHLETYHLRKQKVDDSLSQKAFAEFVKRIDFGKQFLIKDDVQQLEKSQFKLDDQMIDGDLKLVRETKKIMEERIDMAEKFRSDLFKKQFDFNIDENLELDPEKRDFAKNQDALKEQWRKIFKHTAITNYLTMVEGQEKKDETKKGKNKSSKKKVVEKKKQKDLKPEKKLTQSEMLKKAHENAAKKYKRIFDRLKKDRYDDYVEKFMNSISTIFDPHTSYMPPRRKEDFDIDISGSLEGIGAVLQEEDGYIKVVSIVPGGAAWRQKDLEKGDVIISVGKGSDDEEEAVELYDMRVEDAVRYIRGPKGTEVVLNVKKSNGSRKAVAITRDKVVVSESFAKSSILEHESFSGKFGYIQVPKFYRDFGDGSRNVTGDVKQEITRLKKQKIDGLILDLRNNGGGALEDARQITGLFIPKGPVVQTKNHLGQVDIMKDEDTTVAYNGPVIVLVNRFSASASEILAGALQDYQRAVIVGGGNTHGKGTVQVVLNLNSGSLLGRFSPDLGSLKLTIQKFYRVTGDSTQYKGIIPDIIIPDTYDYTKSREQDLDYSLPFDTIKTAKFEKWKGVGPLLPELKKTSQARVKNNDKLQKIQGLVDYLTKRQDETLITLNLTKMRAQDESHDEELEKLKIDEPNKKIKVSRYEASLKSHENIQAKDEKRWKKDFELRKEEWVKSLQLDAGLEEAMFITNDLIHLGKKKMGATSLTVNNKSKTTK